jgi:hypothetical protein
MIQLTNSSEATLPGASTFSLRKRLSSLALALFGIFALAALTAAAASAACGNLGQKPGDAMKFPAEVHGENGWGDSIVGLWNVTDTIGDTTTLFGQSFKQWHSDGTEFENIDHSPIVGNICFGVWKQVAPRTVHLHHTGWLFDDGGAPTGSFIITEVDTVALNGMTYSGTFTFKVYDPNGDYVSGSEVSGKVAATRITVN